MARNLFTILSLLLLVLFSHVNFVDAATPLKEPPPDKVLVAVMNKPKTCRRFASKGNTLTIHYIGKLFDSGTVFENTYELGKPREMKLGEPMIVGFEYGLRDMCVNEKRRLIIPSELAYGEHGSGDIIPPNTAVVFEVELIKISSLWTNPWMWLNLSILVAVFIYYLKMSRQQEIERLKRVEARKAQETKPGGRNTAAEKPNEAKKDD